MLLEDARIDEIVADQKSVLLAFKPAVFAGKSDHMSLRANLVINMVNVAHIPLQFDGFFADELECSVCS